MNWGSFWMGVAVTVAVQAIIAFSATLYGQHIIDVDHMDIDPTRDAVERKLRKKDNACITKRTRRCVSILILVLLSGLLLVLGGWKVLAVFLLVVGVVIGVTMLTTAPEPTEEDE